MLHNALKFDSFLCQIFVVFFSFMSFVKSLLSLLMSFSLSPPKPADDIFREISSFTSRHSSFNDFFSVLLFSGHWPIQCLVIKFRVLPYRHRNMQTGHDDRQRLSSSHVFTNFETTNLRIFPKKMNVVIDNKSTPE